MESHCLRLLLIFMCIIWSYFHVSALYEVVVLSDELFDTSVATCDVQPQNNVMMSVKNARKQDEMEAMLQTQSMIDALKDSSRGIFIGLKCAVTAATPNGDCRWSDGVPLGWAHASYVPPDPYNGKDDKDYCYTLIPKNDISIWIQKKCSDKAWTMCGDACIDPNYNDCPQMCISGAGTFTCQCDVGFTGDGYDCQEIDECADPATNPCEHLCTNTAGSFTCSCQAGYTLYGTQCAETEHYVFVDNKLHYDPAMSVCEGLQLNNVYIKNAGKEAQLEAFTQTTAVTNGGRTGIWIAFMCHVTATVPNGNCTWNDGSPLDWTHSSFVREIYNDKDFDTCYIIKSENDPIIWLLQADCKDRYVVCEDDCANTYLNDCPQLCLNVNEGMECQCYPGYAGNGYNCEEIDECADPAISQCDHICTNTAGSFTCSCQAGYTLYGTHCAETEHYVFVDNKLHYDPAMSVCEGLQLNNVYIKNAGKEAQLEAFTQTTAVTNEGRKGIWIAFKCHVTAAVPNGNCTWIDGSQLEWTHSSFVREVYNNEDFDTCYIIKSENDPIIWLLQADCKDRYVVCEDDCANTYLNDCPQLCFNVNEGMECQCYPGYAGDGYNCVEIDECADPATNPCDHLCTNTAGSFTCSCQAGYTLYGTNCTETEYFIFVPSKVDYDPAMSVCEGLHLNNLNIKSAGKGAQLDAFTQTIAVSNDGRRDGIWMSFKCHVTAVVTNGNCTWNDGSPLEWTHSSFVREVYQDKDFDTCYKLKSENGLIEWLVQCDCKCAWVVCEDDCANTDLNDCPQQCFNIDGGMECQCYPGYTGDGYNCTDIDECADPSTHNCDQICTNTIGSFTCSCQCGYIEYQETCTVPVVLAVADITPEPFGSAATACASVQMSLISIKNPLRQTQIEEFVRTPEMIPYLQDSFWIGLHCLVTGEISICNWAVDDTPLDYTHSSYVAPTNGGTPNVEICFTLIPDPLPIQWFSEGCGSEFLVLCEDSDECAVPTLNTCDQICNNIMGSYSCSCYPGYNMINGSCIDIDECSSNSTNNCHHICNNTMGSYECLCNPGYALNANMCEDIDECSNPAWHNCSRVCINTVTSFYCECDKGFTGSVYDCQDIDECAVQSMNNCTQVCLNTPGSHSCLCGMGYIGNGYNCTEMAGGAEIIHPFSMYASEKMFVHAFRQEFPKVTRIQCSLRCQTDFQCGYIMMKDDNCYTFDDSSLMPLQPYAGSMIWKRG